VFVSGYGSEELSSRGVASGKSAVIEKPFEAEVLLRRVREMLDRTHDGRTDDDGVVRPVRCLACETVYGLPERHNPLGCTGCPRCGYVGWTAAQ